MNQTSFCIVDDQSVKNTRTASGKGYAGNKVSGIKRHIAVDTHDLIHATQVTTANITVQIWKNCEQTLKNSS